MSLGLELDRFSFTKSGAIFAKKQRVFLAWGDPQISRERPISFAVGRAPFFFPERLQWLCYPNVLELDRQSAQVLFRNSKKPEVTWSEPRLDIFTKSFNWAKNQFAQGALKKVVPYVVEVGECRGEDSLLYWIEHSLEQNQGYLYGCWQNGEGFLGLSPELLFSQVSARHLTSMAVAGTRSRDEFAKHPSAFLEDLKEVQEHLLVVEDIETQLSKLGQVSVGERDVLLTPHLAHLYTPLAVGALDPIDLNTALQTLHPTPALACFPRDNWRAVMKQLEAFMPRGDLGAPFVVSYDSECADVVVAIRHIAFSGDQLSLPSGCGVVSASDADKEWNELKKKRESVKSIFGAQ